MAHLKLLAGIFLLLLSSPVLSQIDYHEEEPNETLPASFLSGNPLFLPGDRLIGSISPDDIDAHYIRFKGAETPGIYRYTFYLYDRNQAGGDPVLFLFDTHDSPFLLGAYDDFPGLGLNSRVIFDHFDTTGNDLVYGVGIAGATPFEEFDYAVEWSRERTPVTALGALAGGFRQVVGANSPGEGDWYSFTLDQERSLSIDTLGSELADTELALFDENGNTIAGNDDIDLFGGITAARIETRLPAGTYYVTVGPFDSQYNWNNLLNEPLGWDRAGFSADIFSGRYQLNFHVVPEPGSLFTLASGLSCLALFLKRRRRQRPRL
jgi:hypothetical protein